MTLLTEDEIEENLAELNRRITASEFFGIVNKDALMTMFVALKQSRAELKKLKAENSGLKAIIDYRNKNVREYLEQNQKNMEPGK